jgi:hypothetical protein
VANKRTLARAEGIRMFLSNHLWADTLDLRTFLDGFEAGEEYYRALHPQELDKEELPNVHVKR